MCNEHEVVAGPGEPLHHVWFPTAGTISLVSVMRDGSSVELAMIGPEGLSRPLGTCTSDSLKTFLNIQ